MPSSWYSPLRIFGDDPKVPHMASIYTWLPFTKLRYWMKMNVCCWEIKLMASQVLDTVELSCWISAIKKEN